MSDDSDQVLQAIATLGRDLHGMGDKVDHVVVNVDLMSEQISVQGRLLAMHTVAIHDLQSTRARGSASPAALFAAVPTIEQLAQATLPPAAPMTPEQRSIPVIERKARTAVRQNWVHLVIAVLTLATVIVQTCAPLVRQREGNHDAPRVDSAP